MLPHKQFSPSNASKIYSFGNALYINKTAKTFWMLQGPFHDHLGQNPLAVLLLDLVSFVFLLRCFRELHETLNPLNREVSMRCPFGDIL